MTTTTTTFKVIAAIVFPLLFWGASKTQPPVRTQKPYASMRMDDECLQKLRDTAFLKSGEVLTKIRK